jgi:uncharacterized protein with NRDE domain
MCTLIVLHRRVPGLPLVVAANRDEYLDRPTEGPTLRETEAGPIVAPRDLRAGGTWLGLNPRGLFAAVTNRPTEQPDPKRRSRGLLVTEVLGSSSVAEAARKLTTLEVGAYNPFNLFVADRDEQFAITYEEKPRVVRLSPGATVIGNADPNAAPTPKLERLEQRVEVAAESPAGEVLDALAEICRSHEDGGDPFRDACVHAGRYGTRSSTLISLGDRAGHMCLRHSDSAPCKAPYRDFTPLLHELGIEPGLAGGATPMRDIC